MTPQHIFRVVSVIVGAFAAALLVETGRIALALGEAGGADPVGGASPAGALWYQLSFMRLFGVALLGLAALSLWGASQLTAAQQRSLGRTLGGVFAVLALVAVARQVAIWRAAAGWEVAAGPGGGRDVRAQRDRTALEARGLTRGGTTGRHQRAP